MKTGFGLGILALTGALATSVSMAQDARMSFFITSEGPGDGANLGGLEGADAHCQNLAAAAGAGDKTWRAYLSATSDAGGQTVHARDRIGTGPWFNFNGVQVADDVEGGGTSGALYDREGFCCGSYKLEEGLYCCENCGTESDVESSGTTCRECGRGIISENE